MVTRLFFGSLLAAIVQMGVGFGFREYSGLPAGVLKTVPAEESVVAALKDRLREPGTYVYPWIEATTTGKPTKEQTVAWEKKSKEGPLVQIVYQPKGADHNDPILYLQGFVHFFFSALLVGVLLAMASPSLRTYPARLAFIILAGLFAAGSIALANGIWFHQPWDYPLLLAKYHAASWALAGLFMAFIIKQPGST